MCSLSLHDALPIWQVGDAELGQIVEPSGQLGQGAAEAVDVGDVAHVPGPLVPVRIDTWATSPTSTASADRKSTRLNSSHRWISYAVFCLKKKIARYAGASSRDRSPAHRASGSARAASCVAPRPCESSCSHLSRPPSHYAGVNRGNELEVV